MRESEYPKWERVTECTPVEECFICHSDDPAWLRNIPYRWHKDGPARTIALCQRCAECFTDFPEACGHWYPGQDGCDAGGIWTADGGPRKLGYATYSATYWRHCPHCGRRAPAKPEQESELAKVRRDIKEMREKWIRDGTQRDSLIMLRCIDGLAAEIEALKEPPIMEDKQR